jgi:long-subunit acyl-CoA synthetase (AMP-forming)
MTEASGPVSTNLVPTHGTLRHGSVGQLVPSTEAKIAGLADGRELNAGETGEILVRGPQVMKGYLNNPEATRRTLEPGGWLHTGDVGFAHADGFLTIVELLGGNWPHGDQRFRVELALRLMDLLEIRARQRARQQSVAVN